MMLFNTSTRKYRELDIIKTAKSDHDYKTKLSALGQNRPQTWPIIITH